MAFNKIIQYTPPPSPSSNNPFFQASVSCWTSDTPSQNNFCDTPSQKLLECRDASGRKLWEVISDSVHTVASSVSITRIDFFVR